VLPAVLESVAAERSTALLRLRVADGPHGAACRLLARITSRSLVALQLKAGDVLHAQIKGVALM
jgi:ABC-type molybdate transport system ATPase subunit